MKNVLSHLPLIGSHSEKDRDVLTLLKSIPIFSGLTRTELASVERILHRREYQHEEVIFRQNEPGMGMYIIASGKVHIVSDPRSIIFAELGDGEFFGELALLDDAPRSATAVAKAPTSILGFFQPDLFGLIERNPRLGVKIVLRLAGVIGARLRTKDIQLQAALEQLGERGSSV
ncbi:MAG: cyclic nucleotide-binding domain-containing protein [Ignavibacteria bacterium]|nr:cyclic nucleotide-binding domain-containing protein [Ignavibacteria bacterium]